MWRGALIALAAFLAGAAAVAVPEQMGFDQVLYLLVAVAAAAVAALRELGLREVDVVVRDAGRAGELRTAADRLGMRVVLVPWPGTAWLDAADLVVSTVPAGAADPVVSAGGWSPQPGQLLFDVLYEPWPTVIANVARGAGSITASTSGAFAALPYSVATRIGAAEGNTSPEELLAAAHAGCYAMSLASELTEAGTPPERLDVHCTITMDEVEGAGHRIVASAIEARGRVPDAITALSAPEGQAGQFFVGG